MDSSTSSTRAFSTASPEASACIVGLWSEVDFSDDDVDTARSSSDTCENTVRYSPGLFRNSSLGGGEPFARHSSIGMRRDSDVPLTEQAAETAKAWQHRFNTRNVRDANANASQGAMGGGALAEGTCSQRTRTRTRRVLSVYNIAWQWNIGIEDAFEIAEAFENAQSTS